MASENSATVYKSIQPHLLRTPIIKSEHFSKKYGKNIYFKLECLQKTGSFKARGAVAIVQHVKNKFGDSIKGIVTASGGNHGKGVTFAGSLYNLPCHIFLHTNVQHKKPIIEEMGGTVHIHGSSWDESNKKAVEFASENGLVYVHPFDDPIVMLGQSTVAVELFDQLAHPESSMNCLMLPRDIPKSIDAIVCSVGGGGLIGGVSTYAKSLFPSIKIFGVQTHGANAMYKSVQEQNLVTLNAIESICEGLGVRRVAQSTLDAVMKNVNDIFLVSDKEAMNSLREIVQHEKLLVEPSCSCTIAALEQVIEKNPDLNNIVVILCGSNFPIEKISYLQD